MHAPLVSTVLGVLAAGVAGAILYLGAPQQQLRRARLAPRTTLALVVAFGAVAIALLRAVLGPAEAVYAAILVVMLVTTVLPFLAAECRKRTRSTP